MNYILHKLDKDFIITSDEQPIEGDWCYHPEVSQEYTVFNKGVESKKLHPLKGMFQWKPTENEWYKKARKIIALRDEIDFSNLFVQEQSKIGRFEVDKMSRKFAEEKWKNYESKPGHEEEDFIDKLLGIECSSHDWKMGFSTCQELLVEKRFTLEDIKKAIEFGKEISSEKSFIHENFGSQYIEVEDTSKETNAYIQALFSPTWEIELEMEDYVEEETGYNEKWYGRRPAFVNGKVKIKFIYPTNI